MTDRKRCPTCRQYLPHPAPMGLKLSPQQQVVFNIVRRAGDNGIPTEDIIAGMYSGCRDVPLNARKMVHVAAWHINKQLVPKGWRIRGWSRGRASQGEYFFVRLVDAATREATTCASS